MYGLYVCPLNARAGNFFLKKHGFLGENFFSKMLAFQETKS